MARVQAGINSTQKGAAYTQEEDKSMWDFFVQKVREGSSDAVAKRASIWSEYVIASASQRTYDALEEHFRCILLPRIDNAPIDDEDLVLVLQLCKVNLCNNDAQRNLKRRLRKLCELTIVGPSLFVEKVTRLKRKSLRLSSKIPRTSSPAVVPDTLVEPNKVQNKSEEVFCNEEADPGVVDTRFEEDVVSETFRLVSPNEPVAGDKEYLESAEEVTPSLQKPQCKDVDELEQSPKEHYARKSTKWRRNRINCTTDLSDSPVLPHKMLDEPMNEVTRNQAKGPIVPALVSVPDSQSINFLTDNVDIDLEAQIELDWHKQLMEENKGNPGITPMEILCYKELLRVRIKLTAEELLPVDSVFDGIPDNVKGKVSRLVELLEWCLAESQSTSKSFNGET